MTRNLKLAIATAILFAASLWLYADSASRGDRFARGQRLLPNLNPDEVAAIEIRDGSGTLTLERRGEEFLIAEADDYPARNDEVNRFLRELLDLTLAREVGSSSALAADLGIDPPTDGTIEIALRNISGADMVSLRFGSSSEDESGRYVRRMDGADQPIHLTETSVRFSTTADSYLRKEILAVPQSELARIDGPDFSLGGEDSLALESVPSGRKEKRAETNKLKSFLSSLRFEKVMPADDETVRGLAFQPVLRFALDDGTAYEISTAVADERHYMTIHGSHTVDRVEIALDTPDEELKEKAQQLSRVDEIKDFNDFHASWVYEISKGNADKLALRRNDLLDDA